MTKGNKVIFLSFWTLRYLNVETQKAFITSQSALLRATKKMCDPVSIARKHLLPLLAEAVNMIRRTPVEVEAMKKQLERIQDMIHEADRKASAEGANLKRDEIKEMVKELIEASFEMEDVLDEYILCGQQLQSRDPGCVAFNPEEAANFIRPMITRVQLAYKVQHLNKRVHEIKEKCQIDDGSSSEQGQRGSSYGEHQDPIMRNLREEAPLEIREDDVVGFEVPKAELINWLKEEGEEERLTVIAVVGMGGQGKTTLARKVFENKDVVKHFHCHAWITVSQSYTVEGLLRDMLEQFCQEKRKDPPHEISTMSRNALKNAVKDYMQRGRYVLFFDDVWDIKFWDEIEYSVIHRVEGSRICITTRNEEVLQPFNRSCLVKKQNLKGLDEDKSRELFHKKAFWSNGGRCPEELKDVSFEIVKKCDGLPLAIAVIGVDLCTKDPSEWIEFSENLSSELESDPRLGVVAKILRFSYDDLPSNLKSCLLYFGLYPEDYAVKSKRLIRQWIAEGFIKEQKPKTLEKVAEGYLKELIRRSLVQVSSFTIDGKPKRCRVHDMVREMILTKAKDLIFCHYIHEDDEPALGGKNRRLSIATTSEAFWESADSSHIQSLLFFIDEESPEYFVKRILAQCKLLKVLDFESFLFHKNIPKGCLNLLHLKYLSFPTGRRGRIWDLKGLPESIVELQNLETLDLRVSIMTSIFLPRGIGRLRKLRHLLGLFTCSNDGWNYRIGGLESLQTLSRLTINSSQQVALVKELGELRQLRELRLEFGVKHQEFGLVWDSINKMQHLEKLHLYTRKGFSDFNLISPPPTLRKLYLFGRLEKLPRWISELSNLIELSLDGSRLADDPLKSLKKLPNLLCLLLRNYYDKGEFVHFKDRDFHKLKKLSLVSMKCLKSIVIEKGALHSLREFTLEWIPQLKAVPPGIQHLQKLEVITFSSMPHELGNNITPDGGKDHWIIKHVPSVNIVDPYYSY